MTVRARTEPPAPPKSRPSPRGLVRGLLHRAGIDARRANAMTSWELRLPRLLAQHRIRTVLDVGANDGQYASGLLAGGFAGAVVSFEPLPAAGARRPRPAAGHPRWQVAPRIALSDIEGEADFHEAGNSVSSSLLDMTDVHVEAAPASRIVATTRVQTARLDTVLPRLRCETPIFLKLDVQGAERMVLDGATEALETAIIGVQLEMSLAPLYAGQSSAQDLDGHLRSRGFECWDILPGFRDPASLRMLQYDGVYFRAKR